MTTPGRHPVRWVPTDRPATPHAVAATGDAALALARRLLARDDLAELRGVVGDRVLVVLGPADALPWVDGAVVLGPAPDASGVLWPTARLPDAPVDLVARALVARVAPSALPVAVLPATGQLVPLGDARPIDPDRLREAVAGWSP